MQYNNAFYENKWKKIIAGMPNGSSYRFDLRVHTYRLISDEISADARVFDFDTALGELPKVINLKNKQGVNGCSESKAIIEYLKKRKGDYKNKLTIFGGPYDYIVSTQYLTRASNPVEWLKMCFQATGKVICSIPNNYSRLGENSSMAWSSWASFMELFREFNIVKLDTGINGITKYPKGLGAFAHPIILFTQKTNEQAPPPRPIIKKIPPPGKGIDQTPEYYDKRWTKTIKELPRGGDYRNDLRARGWGIIADYIGKKKRVFDFATGVSFLPSYLNNNDCHVHGCDFSQVAVTYAQQWGNFKVSGEIFGEDYDYITACQFLEHIECPDKWVEAALKKTGNLICSIPNNFRRHGDHYLMAWHDWASFEKLFSKFNITRLDNARMYDGIHEAWNHPTFLFQKKEDKMHPYEIIKTGTKASSHPVKKGTKKGGKGTKKGTKKIAQVKENATVSSGPDNN